MSLWQSAVVTFLANGWREMSIRALPESVGSAGLPSPPVARWRGAAGQRPASQPPGQTPIRESRRRDGHPAWTSAARPQSARTGRARGGNAGGVGHSGGNGLHQDQRDPGGDRALHPAPAGDRLRGVGRVAAPGRRRRLRDGRHIGVDARCDRAARVVRLRRANEPHGARGGRHARARPGVPHRVPGRLPVTQCADRLSHGRRRAGRGRRALGAARARKGGARRAHAGRLDHRAYRLRTRRYPDVVTCRACRHRCLRALRTPHTRRADRGDRRHRGERCARSRRQWCCHDRCRAEWPAVSLAAVPARVGSGTGRRVRGVVLHRHRRAERGHVAGLCGALRGAVRRQSRPGRPRRRQRRGGADRDVRRERQSHQDRDGRRGGRTEPGGPARHGGGRAGGPAVPDQASFVHAERRSSSSA